MGLLTTMIYLNDIELYTFKNVNLFSIKCFCNLKLVNKLLLAGRLS